MPSYSRELTVLGLLGATLWLPHCSQLTKVDWSAIRPGGGASGDVAGTAGTTAGGGAGVPGDAGEGGLGGAAGEGGAGAGGEGDVVDNGGGGASAGIGGLGGSSGLSGTGGTLGGTSGDSGSGGSAGAPLFHPTCNVAPPTPTVPPDLTGKIIFFDGGKGANGNRGGRGSSVAPLSGLDGACAAAKATLQLPGSEVHAVISVAPADEIFDMPALYKLPAKTKPVVSRLGIQIAANWAAIWSTAVVPSLVCTGVMSVGTTRWLTGTGIAKQESGTNEPLFGSYSGIPLGENETCEGWTMGAASFTVRAEVGSAIADSDNTTGAPPWFIAREAKGCDVATDNILCATYDP